MSICECIRVSIIVQTLKFLLSILSFVDRDMMMRHFGTGIGHVDPGHQRNSHEGVSDSGSESDMPEDLDSQHQAPENILEAIGDDAEPLENDSESNSDSSLGSDSHPDSGSPSGSDESSDSDDNGYGSF